MTKDDAKRQKYLMLFSAEADEHLLALGDALLRLEKAPEDRESLANALRRVHTIKGSGQLLGLVDVTRAAHAFEDSLKAVERGDRAVDGRLVDGLLDGVDLLRSLVDQIRPTGQTQRVKTASESPPAPPAAADGPGPSIGPVRTGPPAEEGTQPRDTTAPPPGVRAGNTIRVDVARLDALFHAASALAVGRARVERTVAGCRALVARARGRGGDPLADGLRKLYDALQQSVSELDLAVRDVQDLTVGMRLLPISTLFADYARKVRDLSRELGKEVRLHVEGGESECDKDLIDALADPLVHLVRNAVDHGIEAPDVRSARGKPREGTIAVRALHHGHSLVLEVEDDGAGISLGEVKARAVRLGRLDADTAARMSDAEAAYLVTQSGLTTRETPTEVSGRGIGMDVVRAMVSAWKGDLAIATEAGRGTRYTLTLPISLATTRVLLVESEGRTYALPLGAVATVVRLLPEDHPSLLEAGEIALRGEQLRVVPLRGLLEQPPRPAGPGMRLATVVLRHGAARLALVVDKLLQDEEVVVKSLPVPEGQSPLVAGATLLPDGRVALLLSVPRLLAASGERPPGLLRAPKVRRRRILVVDDSFTTRLLERSILESKGYEVETATSADDALARLAVDEFDLIVSDVQMPPGRDGFDLVAAVRTDARHGKTPCIIVSSLSSAAEKARGAEVGAQAYIVKGEFEQEVLLGAVARLLG